MALEKARAIITDVYGQYNGPGWVPRPFHRRSQRYLWSDAFGVCDLISMHYASGGSDTRYLNQADDLILDVHNSLGCDRWTRQRLKNATDHNPLLGGLRIGKEDEKEDGQYFHYLTKWMFALNRMKIARNDEKYNTWAIQLAESVHPYFVHPDGRGGKAMIWKTDVNLNPLVLSEGNLDPVDGLVTYLLLVEQSSNACVLQQEIDDMRTMVQRKSHTFSSTDELDIGEALWLCSWFPTEDWAQSIAQQCIYTTDMMFKTQRFQRPHKTRLMFREMGLTLGLQCAINFTMHGEWKSRVERLHSFWIDKIYSRDKDISPLMYISSILPVVFQPNRGHLL